MVTDNVQKRSLMILGMDIHFPTWKGWLRLPVFAGVLLALLALGISLDIPFLTSDTNRSVYTWIFGVFSGLLAYECGFNIQKYGLKGMVGTLLFCLLFIALMAGAIWIIFG